MQENKHIGRVQPIAHIRAKVQKKDRAVLLRVYYSNRKGDIWLTYKEFYHLEITLDNNEYKVYNKEVMDRINLAIEQDKQNRAESKLYS